MPLPDTVDLHTKPWPKQADTSLCAGLDLENNAAAANIHMLPDQDAGDFSSASAAKLSLPSAKQSILATAQCTNKLMGQLAPVTNQQRMQQKQPVSGMLKQPGSKATQHGVSPVGWTSPSQMILPRAGIFYCGSFSNSCGLPKQSEHLLN